MFQDQSIEMTIVYIYNLIIILVFIKILTNNSKAMAPEIIQFSHHAITFVKNKSFLLTITNKSATHCLIFKIKTTKLNTYQVKPPLGTIQPDEKKIIEFKLVKPLTEQQMQEAKAKDKFQLQFLTVLPANAPKQKANHKAIWDETKTDPSKQKNIANFTFPIVSDADLNMFTTVGDEPFSPVKLKSAIAKSESKSANVNKLFTLQATETRSQGELSKQFQQLKEREQKLLQQRQKIFKNQPKSSQKTSKNGAQIALLVLAFLVSVLIGNFLKLRVFVQHIQGQV